MQIETVKLFRVADVFGLYADAFVQDRQSGQLIFASFWGRDTTIQELLARLTLSSSEGGLAALDFNPCDNPHNGLNVSIGDPNRLDKLTGRMPADNLFGAVVQLWLYDRKAVEPDHASRRALLLTGEDVSDGQCGSALEDEKVWALFKTASHLPLLDHWRQALISVALSCGWLRMHPGFQVNAMELDLGVEDYEATVSELIRQGRLTLEAGEPQAAREADPLPTVMSASTDENPGIPGRLTAEQLEDGLAQFYGTQQWFPHWLVKNMLYTEGVQFFAEQGGEQGAFWFLDIVATEYFQLQRQEVFMLIKLTSKDKKATVQVENGNGRVLREKKIEYTDLQPGVWKFYLTDDVLLLPGEY